MIRTKPSNIFDFYAPTGGAPKIADFISKASNSAATNPAGQPIIASAPTTSGSASSSTNIPGNSGGDNTWKWVVGGIVVGTIVYLIYDHYQEKKKNEKKNVLYVVRPSDH